MAELFRADSGTTPEHTIGTGFSPELAASGAHGVEELYVPISLPKISVKRRRSEPTVICSEGDQGTMPREESYVLFCEDSQEKDQQSENQGGTG